MQRYKEIDYARAISAILIVCGHVVTQARMQTAFTTYMGRVLYSFHIYVFFLCSGFVSTKDAFATVNIRDYIHKRIVRLLIPYITMGFVYVPFRMVLSKIARSEFEIRDMWKILIGQNPDGSLWFLYMLFIISVLAVLFVKKKNITLCLSIASLLWIVSCVYKPSSDIVLSVCRYSFMFLVGIFIRSEYEKCKLMLKNRKICVLCLVLFTVGNIVDIMNQTEILLPITAISGTFIVMYISINLVRTHDDSPIHGLVNLISLYCMEIYIFAEPFKVVIRTGLNRMNMNLFGEITLTVLGSVFCAIVFCKYIIHKSRILSFLFLGKYGSN